MIYEQRKIVKRFQIALRRLAKEQGIQDKHYISKYVNKEDLRSKLQSNFTKEMNWDNFGEVWEIAHLIPVGYFNHEKEENLKFCWNVKNIVPLLKEDNKNFGSCLLFAKLWFESNKDKDNYMDYINFLNDKMSIYSKYVSK